MTNVLEQAINCDDSDHAARIIQDALGIKSDDLTRCSIISVPFRRSLV
jgi:hypothetical protein